jgi:hypothetical protein
MPIDPSPTVSNIMQQLGAFLVAVLPSDVDVVQGQPNRVPEVSVPRFVIMTPPKFNRLETNIVGYQDAKFTGSITANLLTITAVNQNTPNAELEIGSTIFSGAIPGGLQITAINSGSGQIGTYTLNGSGTVGSGVISAGVMTIQMNAKVDVQLDFHAADPTSADLANTVSTLMRDQFAADQFANQSPNFGVVPLYADDARQAPFQNDQQQIEWRWIVEASLQANIVVSVPLEFADSVSVAIKSALALFPT